MPGSPAADESISIEHSRRPLHPGAALLCCVLIGAGFALARLPFALAAAAAASMALALRVEGRSLRGELPLLLLAGLLFLAHVLFGGRPMADAVRSAGLIALRLLALVYLMRWTARAFLPRVARWLFGRSGPRRPRSAVLLFESGRVTLALLPLALREAERQHEALRARAIRPSGGAGGRARYAAAWILPYLGTMLRIGDAYGEALEARGYVLGRPRRAARLPWGLPEGAALLASLTVALWLVRAR